MRTSKKIVKTMINDRQIFIFSLEVPGRCAIPNRSAVMVTQKIVTYIVAYCLVLTSAKIEKVGIQPPMLLSTPIYNSSSRPRRLSSLKDTCLKEEGLSL